MTKGRHDIGAAVSADGADDVSRLASRYVLTFHQREILIGCRAQERLEIIPEIVRDRHIHLPSMNRAPTAECHRSGIDTLIDLPERMDRNGVLSLMAQWILWILFWGFWILFSAFWILFSTFWSFGFYLVLFGISLGGEYPARCHSFRPMPCLAC